MLQSILNTLFGCSHQRTTFPLTPRRRMVSGRAGAADVMEPMWYAWIAAGSSHYDWKAMRLGQPLAAHVPAEAVAVVPWRLRRSEAERTVIKV